MPNGHWKLYWFFFYHFAPEGSLRTSSPPSASGRGSSGRRRGGGRRRRKKGKKLELFNRAFNSGSCLIHLLAQRTEPREARRGGRLLPGPGLLLRRGAVWLPGKSLLMSLLLLEWTLKRILTQYLIMLPRQPTICKNVLKTRHLNSINQDLLPDPPDVVNTALLLFTRENREKPELLSYTNMTSWVKKVFSRAWFRSTDLWVMGPARFHCATLLLLEKNCWQKA